MQSQAAVFKETSSPLAIQTIEVPPPAAGQLLLKVGACGICGSDLHAVETGYVPADTVMGHEFSGEVVAIGPDIQDQWQLGERVIAAPIMACGDCPECLEGDLVSCRNGVLIGLDEKVSGAYAEYVVVQAVCAIRVPDHVSWEDAAIYEPLSVGLAAFRNAKVAAGESILVLGAGPIGISLIKWARYFGVNNIAVSEPEPVRRQRAGDAGATALIDPGSCDDPAAEFERQTGCAPAVIFECVGRPGILQNMINMAARRTRLVAVGTGMVPEEITVATAALKQLTLAFAFGWHLDDAAFVLERIAANDIDTTGLVTASVSLQQLPDMFEQLQRPNTHCKVMLVPAS